MKVFIVLSIIVAITAAHHTAKHIEGTGEDTGPETPEEDENPSDQEDTAQLRHHFAPSTFQQAQAVPVYLPYPALRSQPAYPAQQIQYVPVYQEYPTARQGVGGGVNANLGPLSGGVGAGIGTGGAGGGFNLGLGPLGGVNANLGFTTPTFLSPTPGYTKYYSPYYTPTKYYTYTPNANNYNYAPVTTTATTSYPVSSIAASSPAVHYSRSVPQGILLPMYY